MLSNNQEKFISEILKYCSEKGLCINEIYSVLQDHSCWAPLEGESAQADHYTRVVFFGVGIDEVVEVLWVTHNLDRYKQDDVLVWSAKPAVQEKNKCICDITTLMNVGCQCGCVKKNA